MVLLVVLGGAHSVLGERYILVRLFRRTDLPTLLGSDDFTRRTLRFAWHLTTVAWWGLAVVVVLLAGGDARGAQRAIGLTALASGLIALVASRARHLAWVVFLVVAAALWIGARVG